MPIEAIAFDEAAGENKHLGTIYRLGQQWLSRAQSRQEHHFIVASVQRADLSLSLPYPRSIDGQSLRTPYLRHLA